MSVLIKGFKVPTGDEPKIFLTHFNDDGTAEMVAVGYPQVMYSVISVPDDHGRLIDADSLETHFGWLSESEEYKIHISFVYSNDIDNAITVVPGD